MTITVAMPPTQPVVLPSLQAVTSAGSGSSSGWLWMASRRPRICSSTTAAVASASKTIKKRLRFETGR
jgi:hypothetical protein